MKRIAKALGQFKEISTEEMQSAGAQALVHLGVQDADRILSERPSVRPTRRWQWPVVAVIAAVFVIAVLVPPRIVQSAPAVLEDASGSRKIQYGEVVRSSDDMNAMMAMSGGARVEVRSMSEFSLERAEDGIRIRLNNGGVIVNAASQPGENVYVQTKDVLASVGGAVSLVKAEEQGSTVASIGGEVRVQQGITERKLRSGEQVMSSPRMEAVSVTEEVAWSREAVAHVALLQQSTAALTSQREAFEVVSIRPNAQVAVPGARGGGGVNNVGPSGCAAAPFQLDPRRFALIDTNAWSLITTAYSGNPSPQGCADLSALNLISGGPSWIRSDKWDVEATIPQGSPSYTAEQLRRGEAAKLRKMVLTLLEDRFMLVVRREMKEVPAYVLTAEPGAPKFIVPSAYPGGFEDPTFRKYVWDSRATGASPSDVGIVAKEASMADVTAQLARATGRPVVDRTGITGSVSFILNYDPRTGRNSTAQNLGQTFAKGLEQVGFKLSDGKTSVETWVIERIEKPSDN